MTHVEGRAPLVGRAHAVLTLLTVLAVLATPLAASADPAATPAPSPPGRPGFSVGDLGRDAASRAPTLAQAQAAAARLRQETDALVRQAGAAADRAETAELRYHAAVTRAALAEHQLADAQRAAVATDADRVERVRAIYMAGGRAGMLNSLMGSRSLSELDTRGQLITGVVLDGEERARDARRHADAAARVRAELRRLAEEQTAAVARATREVAEAVRLLAERRQLLRDTDATVTTLLAEQRQAAQEATARQLAARQLAAVRATSGTGPPGNAGSAGARSAGARLAGARSAGAPSAGAGSSGARSPGTRPADPRSSARATGSGRVVPVAAGGGSWARPAVGPLVSRYGPRWGRVHRGIDIGARNGSVIRAASDGVVTLARWWSGYGNAVVVDHGGGLTTRYGHSSQLLVLPGDSVVAGQPIALVGSTGRSSGPHLHFEVRVGGTDLDPLPFLTDRGVRLG